MTEPVESAEVVVLGGGPAGLGAAYRLAMAGRSVIVVEAADHVGGLAASFDVAGVRVDQGSHRLHCATAPEIMHALRALLGDDLQLRRRNGRIRIADRFVAFPPRPGDLALHLPARLAARLAGDLLLAPARRRRSSDGPGRLGCGDFASAVRQQVGPTLAREVYDPYVTKLFGLLPCELDAELARRRVAARTGGDLLRKLARRRAAGGYFHAPVRGFGQIPDALAGAASDSGAEIRLGVEVARVETDDTGATISFADGAAVQAGQVWSTIPLRALARIGGAPQAVLDAAAGLMHRALVLVYLALDRPQWTEFDAHYFPSLDVAFHRVSEPKNYRHLGGDPRDVTVLCAEIACDVGDATWCATPQDLGTLVGVSLEREGLPPTAPVHVEVRRVAHAYPVYDLGFAVRLALLDGWVDAQPRLLSLGRQGLFAHDNTHHALAMAWAAADALRADGTFDSPRWSASRAEFASHVVED